MSSFPPRQAAAAEFAEFADFVDFTDFVFSFDIFRRCRRFPERTKGKIERKFTCAFHDVTCSYFFFCCPCMKERNFCTCYVSSRRWLCMNRPIFAMIVLRIAWGYVIVKHTLGAEKGVSQAQNMIRPTDFVFASEIRLERLCRAYK
ncbi:unnamed protein product [Ectocarpus sp. 4 AP-2014]